MLPLILFESWSGNITVAYKNEASFNTNAGMCKELGRLTQGYDVKGFTYHTKRTNTMRYLDHRGVSKIPRNRVGTYARIVADYQAHTKRPQSSKDNCLGEFTQRETLEN